MVGPDADAGAVRRRRRRRRGRRALASLPSDVRLGGFPTNPRASRLLGLQDLWETISLLFCIFVSVFFFLFFFLLQNVHLPQSDRHDPASPTVLWTETGKKNGKNNQIK